MFKYASPICLKLKEKQPKISAFYAANFDCNGENAKLYISCRKSSKVTVNGDFAGYFEPSVDDYKIDCFEVDISEFVSWGLNQIVIEVYSDSKDDAYVIAEVEADGEIKCATGKNFIAFIDAERLFDENALINAVHYEHYQKGGVCMLKGDVEVKNHSHLYIDKKVKPVLDTEPVAENENLEKGESKIFALSKSENAFVELTVFVKEKSKLRLEVATDKKFTKKQIIDIDFIEGEYTVQNHSLLKGKYIKASLKEGVLEIDSIKLNKYKM